MKIGNSITHFNVVVPVIMQIKNPVNLTIPRHVQVICGLGSIGHRLARVLLHLDVVELSAREERKGD